MVANPLGFRYLILFRIALLARCILGRFSIPACQLAHAARSFETAVWEKKVRPCARTSCVKGGEKGKENSATTVIQLGRFKRRIPRSTNWRMFNVLETATSQSDASDSFVKRLRDTKIRRKKRRRERLNRSEGTVLGPPVCLLDRWMRFKCEFPMAMEEEARGVDIPLNFILIFYSISSLSNFIFIVRNFLQCFHDSKFLILLKRDKVLFFDEFALQIMRNYIYLYIYVTEINFLGRQRVVPFETRLAQRGCLHALHSFPR